MIGLQARPDFAELDELHGSTYIVDPGTTF